MYGLKFMGDQPDIIPPSRAEDQAAQRAEADDFAASERAAQAPKNALKFLLSEYLRTPHEPTAAAKARQLLAALSE